MHCSCSHSTKRFFCSVNMKRTEEKREGFGPSMHACTSKKFVLAIWGEPTWLAQCKCWPLDKKKLLERTIYVVVLTTQQIKLFFQFFRKIEKKNGASNFEKTNIFYIVQYRVEWFKVQAHYYCTFKLWTWIIKTWFHAIKFMLSFPSLAPFPVFPFELI